MIECYLIRHGKTEGNLKGRYLGRTDESLAPSGKEALYLKKYPAMDAVFVSPLKRCKETAAILFPGKCQFIESDLRECDFGIFENKNWRELEGNKAYQDWIDSNGTLPFPGGESGEKFRYRCEKSFSAILKLCIKKGWTRVAFVIHGGTIRSILAAFAKPEKGFYDWDPKNGGGYLVTAEAGQDPVLSVIEEFT